MKPLAGRRILITRARQQAGSLAEALQALGAEVLTAPMIEIAPPDSYAPLDAALQNLAGFGWLILTSANGARVFAERASLRGIQPERAPGVRIAAVGPATAQALQERGWPVHCTPKAYVAESLLDALRESIGGQNVLLVRAKVARDVIPDELAQMGAELTVADAYQTVTPADASARLHAIFAHDERLPHLVTFTSSSTVQNFFRLLRAAGFEALPAGIATASIGPITSQTLREHGIEPSVEADEHTIEGLTAAIAKYFSVLS